MRRSMLFTAMFLILAGLTLLIRSLFRLYFPAFSVLFSEALVLLGIYLITGGNRGSSPSGPTTHARGREHSVLFSSSPIVGSSDTAKYAVIFSSTTIELPSDAPDMVEISCVFSDVRVLLPKDRAVRVRMSSAFSSASMPGCTVAGFGQREVLLGEGVASYLKADAVFSSLYIA